MNPALALNLYSNLGPTEEASGSAVSKTPVGIAESLFKSVLKKENAATSQGQTGLMEMRTAGNRQDVKSTTGSGKSLKTRQALEIGLFGSGFFAGMVKLAPEAGEKLLTLLQKHGFGSEQSNSLIKAATDNEGFIHLDRLMTKLGQSEPSATKDQTSLIIASRDVPQFQQVLFKMGLGVAQVKSLVENCDDGIGNMLLEKVYSELSSKSPDMGSQVTLIHLLSHFGIQCKPENVSRAIDPKEFLALMNSYAAAPSESAQEDIKSALAGILGEKGVPPQKVKSFLDGMTVEYAKSVARSGEAENGKSTTAEEVGLWNGIVLKPQHEMQEKPWTEKILAILKDSRDSFQNGVQSHTEYGTKGQDNGLRTLYSQLMEKEAAGSKAISVKAASVLNSGEVHGAVKGLMKMAAEKSGDWQPTLSGTMASGQADPAAGAEKAYTAAQEAELPTLTSDYAQNASPVSGVLDRMQWMLDAGQQKARIQLSPPDLGHIDIQLVIDQGHLRATLGTESAHVKEMIQSNLGQLKQELSHMGFVVDEFNVGVGMDNRKSRSDDDQWGRKAQVGLLKAARGKRQPGPIFQKDVPVRTRTTTDYQVSVRV
jgi:hypothetical protein